MPHITLVDAHVLEHSQQYAHNTSSTLLRAAVDVSSVIESHGTQTQWSILLWRRTGFTDEPPTRGRWDIIDEYHLPALTSDNFKEAS